MTVGFADLPMAVNGIQYDITKSNVLNYAVKHHSTERYEDNFHDEWFENT